LKKEACSYEVIINIFSHFGRIEAVKFIVKDNYKNMCLVKLASVEESFIAMANL